MKVRRDVLRSLIFFALLGAALAAAHWAITFGLRHISTSSFGVTNRIVRGQINADIIITGSSRALTHYDSTIIREITGRSTFNIGVNGSQTDLQLAVLKTYLSHNRPPLLVIHNLDLFSFLISHEIYDPAQYLPYLNETPIYSAVRRVYPSAWKWKYLPLYGYAVEDMRFDWLNGIGCLMGHQPSEDHFQGYVPRHTPWTGDFDQYRRDHAGGSLTGTEPQGIQDLTELAEICHRQKIPLLFVYSPEYIEMQALERDRTEIFALFRGIASRYNVTFWDYSSSPLCRSRDNFYNSQHLNADGAAAFSADFARKLAQSTLLGAQRALAPR